MSQEQNQININDLETFNAETAARTFWIQPAGDASTRLERLRSNLQLCGFI